MAQAITKFGMQNIHFTSFERNSINIYHQLQLGVKKLKVKFKNYKTYIFVYLIILIQLLLDLFTTLS